MMLPYNVAKCPLLPQNIHKGIICTSSPFQNLSPIGAALVQTKTFYSQYYEPGLIQQVELERMKNTFEQYILIYYYQT